MQKVTVVVALALFVLAGAVGIRALTVSKAGTIEVAVGGAPVPPDPWKVGGAPVPPDPWKVGGAPVPPDPWKVGGAPVPPDPWRAK
jgi:hypothetical protein